MKQTRTPAPPRGGSSRGEKGEEGVTLVALVIGIAILTIVLAGVAPSVGAIMKRDREEELIFRGKQYARAILIFQKRYGRYPNQLKELYENRPRAIRKLWKDPTCNCDFHALIQGMPDAGVGPGPVTTPPLGFPGGPAPAPTPTPAAAPAPIFGTPTGPQTVGPIVGVRSSVHKEALREWRGQKYYDQWRFIAGDADRDLVGNAPSVSGPLPPGVPRYPTPVVK